MLFDLAVGTVITWILTMLFSIEHGIWGLSIFATLEGVRRLALNKPANLEIVRSFTRKVGHPLSYILFSFSILAVANLYWYSIQRIASAANHNTLSGEARREEIAKLRARGIELAAELRIYQNRMDSDVANLAAAHREVYQAEETREERIAIFNKQSLERRKQEGRHNVEFGSLRVKARMLVNDATSPQVMTEDQRRRVLRRAPEDGFSAFAQDTIYGSDMVGMKPASEAAEFIDKIVTILSEPEAK